MAEKELTAQDAKDLAYKYQDNPEIYNLAKNLEDVLDGTVALETHRTEKLEDELADAEADAKRYEGKYDDLRDETIEFIDEVLEVLDEDSLDKEKLITKINAYRGGL